MRSSGREVGKHHGWGRLGRGSVRVNSGLNKLSRANPYNISNAGDIFFSGLLFFCAIFIYLALNSARILLQCLIAIYTYVNAQSRFQFRDRG